MSINALGVVTTSSLQEINKDSAAKAGGTKGTAARHQTSTEDTTSFTSNKQTIQSLSQTAVQTIPSRQVKVEALKQAVSSAQYQLDSDKIAESLVNADI